MRSGRGVAAWPSGSASTAPTTSRASSCKSNGQSGFLDHESLKPEKIDPDVGALFRGVNVGQGRVAHRLRLDHGRGPAQAGVPQLTEPNRVAREPRLPRLRSVVRRRRMTTGLRSGPVRCPPTCWTTWSTLASRAAERRQDPGLAPRGAGGHRTRPGSGTSPCPPTGGTGSRWPGLLDAPVHRCCPWPIRAPTSPATPSPTRRPPGSAGGRGLAGAVLDGGHRLRRHDPAAGGRGARSGHPVLRRSSRARPSCGPRCGIPEGLELLGAIALGWPVTGSGAEVRPGQSAGRRRRPPGGDHPPGRVVTPDVDQLSWRCRTPPGGTCSHAGWPP